MSFSKLSSHADQGDADQEDTEPQKAFLDPHPGGRCLSRTADIDDVYAGVRWEISSFLGRGQCARV